MFWVLAYDDAAIDRFMDIVLATHHEMMIFLLVVAGLSALALVFSIIGLCKLSALPSSEEDSDE